MAKTNWKYRVIEKDGKRCEWSNPRSKGEPEIAADIGVYEKDKLLAIITVMGLNNKDLFPDDEALKKHLRMRAMAEIAAQAKREEDKEAAKVSAFPDELADSFDPLKIKDGPPV